MHRGELQSSPRSICRSQNTRRNQTRDTRDRYKRRQHSEQFLLRGMDKCLRNVAIGYEAKWAEVILVTKYS